MFCVTTEMCSDGVLKFSDLQKGSFWHVKGFLLVSKRNRFALQKDSFWNGRWLLLEIEPNCANG